MKGNGEHGKQYFKEKRETQKNQILLLKTHNKQKKTLKIKIKSEKKRKLKKFV